MNEKTKTKRVGQGLTLSGKADRLATSYLCGLSEGLKAQKKGWEVSLQKEIDTTARVEQGSRAITIRFIPKGMKAWADYSFVLKANLALSRVCACICLFECL